MYWMTLYGKDDLEIWTHRYSTKAEQMAEYYTMRANGYPASRLEKGKYSY